MRKFFLTLALVIVAASLKAVTIQWSTPVSANDPSGWTYDIVGTKETSKLGIYFVYAQDGGLSHQDVWSKANSGTGVTVIGAQYANEEWSTTVNGSVVTHSELGAIQADNYTTMDVYLTLHNTVVSTTGGYFYMVVFDPDTMTQGENALYAVSNAVQYTGNVDDDKENGIYATTAGPGDDLSVGNFVDITWLGGHWQAVPEPTSLALLALGVAGLALRRKI